MSKKTIIIVAVVALLMAGGGIAGGVYMSQSGMLGETEEGAEAAEAPSVPEGAPAAMIEFEPFLTNTGGSHHARLAVKIAVSPDTRAEEIKADAVMMARMRDQVLTLLSTRGYADLSDAAGRQTFREELHGTLDELIADAELEDVLFGDFVVQ